VLAPAPKIDRPPAPGDGDRIAPLAEIERLRNDDRFQSSLRDIKHPMRAANLARWENAHERAFRKADG
jgi:hypothetical protein